jgi:class 3 adenylate cyclase
MRDILTLTSEDAGRVDLYRSRRRVSLLTIMFSDIVGYTALCERHSADTMSQVRSCFEQVTTTEIESSYHGLIVKRIGDAVLAIFAEPTAAVSAALSLHQRLAEEPIEEASLQLRTGIHIGQVSVESVGTQIDVFGRHVNRAARVQGIAEPGEVLVTEAVEDNVRGWINTPHELQVRFRRRRTQLLKGLDAPITVYTAVPETAETDDVESRTPDWFIHITVTEGAQRVSDFQFDGNYDRRIMIGRHADCEIALQWELHVSRKHAMIWSNNEGQWEVQDLGSHGGIKHNGNMVSRSVLHEGDRIECGATLLTVQSLRNYSQKNDD